MKSNLGRWLLFIVLFSGACFANQAYVGYCSNGGTKVVTSGITSTTSVMASYPGCTVTVNNLGGGLATIFSDNLGTPLSNPFQASLITGQFIFYANNARYSITLSGGTPLAFPLPVTITDVLLNDPASPLGCLSIPALTGDVTSAGGTCATVLPNIAAAGTGLKTTINAKGQVTGVTTAASTDLSDTAVIARLNAAANFGANPVTTGALVSTTGTFSGSISGTGATFTSEIAPSVTGVQLGDTAHRWDLLARNIDWSGTFSGGLLSPLSLAVTNNATIGGSLTVTGPSTLSSVNLIQFPTTGADCGFQAAYTALPSSGGTVILGADCTISSAQTLTLVAGKPLFIDLGGRKISMSQAAGVGLTIIKPDTTPRDPFGISNGVFIYTGVANSVTGVQIGNGANPATDVSLVNVAIDNFSTTGSVGLNLTNVQDSRLEAVGFNGNTTGLSLNLNSVQIQYDNVHFQGNSLAIVATDAYEQTFHDCLIQSSTGTKPVQIIATTINVINWRFKHCHFENNGDTTANTRQISFQPGVGKSISQVFLESNIFNSGANVNAGSFVFELTGAGTFSFLSLKHNRYFTAANQFTGIGANTVTTEGENSQGADVSISGSAVANADGAGSGLVLAPIGSARKFQIYAGYPTQFDGSLIIKDLTANANILRYTSGLFDFQINTVKGNTLQSVVATGTAPLVIASTTPVANLTVQNCSTCVLTGTPTGTGIQTATLKTGTGAGNYTSASTTYVRVDSTNLAYTVTIPTGWKLMAHASGTALTTTASVQFGLALADGSADNTGILVESKPQAVNATVGISFSLDYIIAGDGASHTINLQYLTTNGADSVVIANGTSTFKPTMTFLLTPSN